MSKVDGMVEDGFETIRDAFAEAQVQDEGGAQLCIYRHGKRVVDLWTGRDKVNDRPYTADTISIIMSCGKVVTATCAHLLVERGLLDPDAPVAHYWPEFAANGKANIPVSYLLSHRAGLPSFPPESGIALNEMLDWNRCVTALAEMKPLWTPGTAFRYHQFTYGYLVGEVGTAMHGGGQFGLLSQWLDSMVDSPYPYFSRSSPCSHFMQRGFLWPFMSSCSCSWSATSSVWRCFAVIAGSIFSLPIHEEKR